jgi:dipeptidyl aminopeptidase/acylaminoacyl peptidase
MITPHIDIGTGYPIHAFLHNGVAVLIPNSRGRAGYGVDFERAWETERDYAEGPLQDLLAGIELLVRQGIVDSDRVAVAGHSWGGYLAAYALTHTDRFKAVLVHEAVSLNTAKYRFRGAGSLELTAINTQFGMSEPFQPGAQEQREMLSPVYQAERAMAPSLLEFGGDSNVQEGRDLFEALKHFNRAPTELISYPATGHVTEQPALRYDAARRELEWFAYWVLGKPTERMRKRYGLPGNHT